ncbi:MAG: hypothetical protein ILP01_01320, partial [Clostridia bacterium]|nr:hypothetical protein [Clostridia bacterium]
MSRRFFVFLKKTCFFLLLVTADRKKGKNRGVLKKSDFFNTPAESADRIPQILLGNPRFLPLQSLIIAVKRAKTPRS